MALLCPVVAFRNAMLIPFLFPSALLTSAVVPSPVSPSSSFEKPLSSGGRSSILLLPPHMNLPTVHCDSGCRGPKNMIFRVLLIALLVFGANVATAADPAETSSTTDATTLGSTTTTYCDEVTATHSAVDVIRDCNGSKTLAVKKGENFVFDISTIDDQNKVNSFFKSLPFSFPFDFRLENNDKIEEIDFGVIALFGADPVFTIKNNRNLKDIKGGDSLLKFRGHVSVHGNRLLTQSSIDKLKKALSGTTLDIQEVGECFVPSLITDLKELDDCHYVVGNLSFVNWPIGTTSNEIKWITGNVKIVNTDLTKLPFSQTEKIKVDGNFEFKDNIGLCWINDENYKDYFDVKGKVRIRNTPCPYPPSLPMNKTTKKPKKTKKSKKTTTTAAPVVTEEATTKESNTILSVVQLLPLLFTIFM